MRSPGIEAGDARQVSYLLWALISSLVKWGKSIYFIGLYGNSMRQRTLNWYFANVCHMINSKLLLNLNVGPLNQIAAIKLRKASKQERKPEARNLLWLPNYCLVG